MSKIYIYLAGPIRGVSERGACEWREVVTKALAGANDNYVAVSPLRCEPPDAEGMYPVDYSWELAHSITAKNQLDVGRCDAVLAYLPRGAVSVGTILEIGWASAKGKTVIIVSDDPVLLSHPILMATVPFRFDSSKQGWKKALTMLTDLYGVYI